jgi:hypothetical protein
VLCRPPDRNDWITPLELQMMNDCAVEVTPPMYRCESHALSFRIPPSSFLPSSLIDRRPGWLAARRSGSKWFCAGDAPRCEDDSMNHPLALCVCSFAVACVCVCRAITMCQENLDQKHAVSRWQPSEFVLSSGPAELREAVADIMLMATSDELIINPWSSYGQMAAVRCQSLVACIRCGSAPSP